MLPIAFLAWTTQRELKFRGVMVYSEAPICWSQPRTIL
jgi:hypothetical protein